ncbi:ABC transporter substrate-binding protein [Thiorhodococcus mannitoliphagus]|uniref:ABC transporter substrate-binding protein n=1 Tax=Thiorhodococcus mannitoliphagus TaxID=329406 RepID=A0A6P1DX57_9GAMM|nr:ABC transporter substrate-binding protein [Thiorhodococcus mannitoliphagus]NEX22897.1 ABC transporter substrate-binding protein [Thiorhodococcus mannitoliphagus]
MKKSKTVAISLTLLGIILAIAGPFLPGGTHLIPNDPPRASHVTVLQAIDDDVLAGTQTGEIWRLHGGIWTQERIYLGENPVMAILGAPGRSPIGTANGLYNAPVGAPPLEGRISSLTQTSKGLIAGTPSGVRLLAKGRWQTPGPAANIYSLLKQSGETGEWIHAGTVGDGVLSTPGSGVDQPWQPNSLGLPKGVNVFSLTTTKGGLLLAGTDQGLFWQTQPGERWQTLHPELAGKRILAMYFAPGDGIGGADRLWIGGDLGLQWLDLSEQAGAPTPLGQPMAADSAEFQPQVGVSWILSNKGQLMLSAGSVYKYGPTQLAGWYWISIVGVVLILLAAWWMPQPPPAIISYTSGATSPSSRDTT